MQLAVDTTKSEIDAVVTSSGTGTAADVRSFGRGVVFNVLGFDVNDILTKSIDQLIGDPDNSTRSSSGSILVSTRFG